MGAGDTGEQRAGRHALLPGGVMAEPITCPVCRARVETGPQCRRCKADLSLLFALEGRRDVALAAARRALAAGRAEEALTSAREAEQLRHGADARRLMA